MLTIRGATYCGTGCTSNCNAHAECGKDALVPGQACPLNVWYGTWHSSENAADSFAAVASLVSVAQLQNSVLGFARVIVLSIRYHLVDRALGEYYRVVWTLLIL